MIIDRLQERDRRYRRIMGVTLAVSVVAHVVLLNVIPAERITALQGTRIAQPGVLEILPELDILPDEVDDRHLTAAPNHSPATDFVAVDLDFVRSETSPPLPEPRPETRPEKPLDEPVQQTLDDIQDEIRTTGQPVLAQSEIQLVHLVRPVYPRSAVVRGEEGTIEVLLNVSVYGRVVQAHVVGAGRHPRLESSAVEALKETLFKPYRVNGVPSPFWVMIPVEFRLVK